MLCMKARENGTNKNYGDGVVMKKENKYHFWKSSLRGLYILFRLQPVGMVLYILGSTVHGLSWAWEIVCMQYFFDTVSQAACGEAEIEEVFVWLIITGISYIFSQFMNGAFNCYGQICNLKISRNMNEMLFNRTNAMELEEHENVAQMERLNRAINGSQFLFWVCTTILDLVFYYGIYFLFIGGYMMYLEPVLGCSIILIFVPCLLSKMANYYIFGKKEKEAASVRRHAEYYEKYMVDKAYFKETRLWGAENIFYDRFEKALIRLGKIEWKAQKTKSLTDLAARTVTVICYCMILYMLVVFIMGGKISVGAFAAILGSLSRLYSNMDELISERIGWASENVASVDNFLEFVEEQTTERRNIDIQEFQEILLQQVSFTYPEADMPAVRDINLSIKRGETLAIVGENGSGKSTLCRLIMGLYTPSIGSVLYDGKPSGGMRYTGISAVFQDYCRYKMKVWENICISDTEKNSMKELTFALCQRVGLKLGNENLPDGQDTMLGRDFGGSDLSGGQWQRLALARGMYRDHVFIVLDEPTAALDPLEEVNVYRQFEEMCRDKTAIVVTHRTVSAKVADRILVLKDGKIIQEGSFRELSETKGEFQRMYEEQRKWYVESVKM